MSSDAILALCVAVQGVLILWLIFKVERLEKESAKLWHLSSLFNTHIGESHHPQHRLGQGMRVLKEIERFRAEGKP